MQDQDVNLTGHHSPRPLTVCIVKEIKRCPHCNADEEHGFEVLIEEPSDVLTDVDEPLTFGLACLCWCCGFRF
jgi:hypothetical protein